MRLIVSLALIFAFTGCSESERRSPVRDSGTSEVDAGSNEVDAGDDVDAEMPMEDAGPPALDAGPVDICNPGCGPEELCGMGSGDGLDNDCDNAVDEGCACELGDTRPCFAGEPDRRDIGVCSDGQMTCGEFGWLACGGGISPSPETCDGADNDCNGVADDGLIGCDTAVICPGSQAATPLNNFALEGTAIYRGLARAWNWEISCPPSVDPCPVPDNPNTADTSIYFLQSGSYRASLEVVTEEGATVGCEWIIEVQGAGLRVELDWDSQGSANGNTDVDLHLHRRTTPPGSTARETDFFTSDDCYFSNCKSGGLDWGMANTEDVTACSGAPRGAGEAWVRRGYCANPRLDIDVIRCDSTETDPQASDFCAPENINVDNPNLGEPFRVMVDYYSDNSYDRDTFPTVNIYCGGALRGAFGRDPVQPISNAGGASKDRWHVADVVFFEDECGEIDCLINPLGYVRQDNDFGEPWSY